MRDATVAVIGVTAVAFRCSAKTFWRGCPPRTRVLEWVTAPAATFAGEPAFCLCGGGGRAAADAAAADAAAADAAADTAAAAAVLAGLVLPCTLIVHMRARYLFKVESIRKYNCQWLSWAVMVSTRDGSGVGRAPIGFFGILSSRPLPTVTMHRVPAGLRQAGAS